MEIATRRFLLRDFVESDRAAFIEYQADPHSLTFYDPNDSSPDRALRLFEMFQAWAGDLPRLNYQLAIVTETLCTGGLLWIERHVICAGGDGTGTGASTHLLGALCLRDRIKSIK
jgi:RimJ/RimL family protein N-acetyltransferase